MYPDYSESNAYQRHLRDAVTERGYDVRMVGADRVLPLLGAVRTHGRPDIFHVNWLHRHFVTGSSLLTAVLAFRLLFELLVLRALGVELVWTVHNLVEHSRRTPRLELAVRRLAAQLCDRIIVHCESARDLVVDTYRLPAATAERIEVVPHGHYIDSYPNEVSRETARESLGYDDDQTVFLYFGLIRSYKNVPNLVRTFSSIDDPDARLLVVGNPMSEELATEVRTLCERDDRVACVLQFVPDGEIQQYMNAADAVVLPFEEVLTSGTAILAMSFGRALVAPRAGCVAELIDADDPLGYQPSNPGGLRQSLCTALDEDADVDAVGRANRELVTTLDWNGIADRTVRAYARGAR
ncbi:glycosyltransferase [Halomarina oriensis]|uniref:Glycosyltransferase n=2 Tax=Halomarina oriensis TaxID=671145 RepID=A0A6B0GUM0_9EURY|nr:glycosyltransferase [Halomarina oriensis]